MNKINVNINVDSVDMKSLFNADAIEMNKNLNLSNNSSVTTNQNLNTALTETLDISAVNKETETLSLTNNQANNPQVSNFSPNSYSDKDNADKQIEELRADNDRLINQLDETSKQSEFRAQSQSASQSTVTNFDILKRLSNLERQVFGSKLDESALDTDTESN